MPCITSAMYKKLDVESCVKRLKALAAQKKLSTPEGIAVYNEMKVLAISRLFAGMYAVALLKLMLSVQLHMLSRYSYKHAQQKAADAAADPADAKAASARAQEEEAEDIKEATKGAFLNHAVTYMQGAGMGVLCEHVQAVVSKQTEENPVSQNMGFADVAALFKRIREAIEAPVPGAESQHPLMRFALWPDAEQLTALDQPDAAALELLNEAWYVHVTSSSSLSLSAGAVPVLAESRCARRIHPMGRYTLQTAK
jgi:hypothetical protein